MSTAPRTAGQLAAQSPRPRRRSRRVAAVLLLPSLLLACSTLQKGATVDSSLTETAAKTRMVELLAGSLAGLPATASLDVANPRAPQNPFPPSQTAPCNDNDTNDTGPVDLAMYRWVVDGSPAHTVGDVAKVSANWSASGWNVQTRSDGSAVTTTPDGYGLRASMNDQGDLGIIASSPCFPRANIGGAPAPRIISRPAS